LLTVNFSTFHFFIHIYSPSIDFFFFSISLLGFNYLINNYVKKNYPKYKNTNNKQKWRYTCKTQRHRHGQRQTSHGRGCPNRKFKEKAINHTFNIYISLYAESLSSKSHCCIFIAKYHSVKNTWIPACPLDR